MVLIGWTSQAETQTRLANLNTDDGLVVPAPVAVRDSRSAGHAAVAADSIEMAVASGLIVIVGIITIALDVRLVEVMTARHRLLLVSALAIARVQRISPRVLRVARVSADTAPLVASLIATDPRVTVAADDLIQEVEIDQDIALIATLHQVSVQRALVSVAAVIRAQEDRGAIQLAVLHGDRAHPVAAVGSAVVQAEAEAPVRAAHDHPVVVAEDTLRGVIARSGNNCSHRSLSCHYGMIDRISAPLVR
jgi:hypothetical protein